jgi:hypothetical protein
MSKQIILDALASQFVVKQNEFLQYETTVYSPALEGLNKSISDWFSSVLSVNPHSTKYTGDTLEIVPMNEDNGRWPSAINIRKHYSYRDDENNYYDIDYRSSHNKVDTTNMYYLTTLGKVAQHSALIIDNIENEWKPTYKAIYNPYYELSNELRKLEQEINTIKRDIHTAKREEYKVAGFEHTISPNLYCKINYDTNQYELTEIPTEFNLETGRGKWDYTNVNAYRVVGPAKYNKIALQVKRKDDLHWSDIDIKHDYFDSFIETVYDWETSKKAKSDADETTRYNRYVGQAEQTA